MQKLHAKTWLSLPLAALIFYWVSGVCVADTPVPDMVVTGSGPGSMVVGDSSDISLDAVVNNEPKTNAECTITGPKWSWSVSVSGGPDNNGNGASASLDSPENPDEEDDSATLTLSVSKVGTYRISISASALYTSSCKDGDVNVPGGTTFDVTVVDFSVTIIQSQAVPNPVDVGQVMEIKLDAKLNIPAGASVTTGPFWEWDFGTIQYRESETDPWSDHPPGFEVEISGIEGESKATYRCVFYAAGQYRIQVKAVATFKAVGKSGDITKEGKAYAG